MRQRASRKRERCDVIPPLRAGEGQGGGLLVSHDSFELG
jgi:hypothetical protein